jgi:hypothetical protein
VEEISQEIGSAQKENNRDSGFQDGISDRIAADLSSLSGSEVRQDDQQQNPEVVGQGIVETKNEKTADMSESQKAAGKIPDPLGLRESIKSLTATHLQELIKSISALAKESMTDERKKITSACANLIKNPQDGFERLLFTDATVVPGNYSKGAIPLRMSEDGTAYLLGISRIMKDKTAPEPDRESEQNLGPPRLVIIEVRDWEKSQNESRKEFNEKAKDKKIIEFKPRGKKLDSSNSGTVKRNSGFSIGG